jgi:hypothetical protein
MLCRADSPELQAALSRRAAALAEGESSSRRPFSVSSGTDHIRLAGLLSSRLSAEGWVELITQGRQDLALPIALQASAVSFCFWASCSGLPLVFLGTLSTQPCRAGLD